MGHEFSSYFSDDLLVVTLHSSKFISVGPFSHFSVRATLNRPFTTTWGLSPCDASSFIPVSPPLVGGFGGGLHRLRSKLYKHKNFVLRFMYTLRTFRINSRLFTVVLKAILSFQVCLICFSP